MKRTIAWVEYRILDRLQVTPLRRGCPENPALRARLLEQLGEEAVAIHAPNHVLDAEGLRATSLSPSEQRTVRRGG